MSSQRFSTGKCFRWQGVTYEVQRLLAESKLRIENLLTGEALLVEVSTLVKALFNGELEFIHDTSLTLSNPMTREETGSYTRDLTDYPEHLVAIARHRLDMIQPLLDMKSAERTRAVVEKHVQQIRAALSEDEQAGLQGAASLPSIYRWIKNYTESGHDLRALIPDTQKRGGCGVSRLSEEVEAIVGATIHDKCHRREVVTIDDVVHEITVRLAEENRSRAVHEKLEVPSRRTIARRVFALDKRSRYADQHGARAAKREFSQYGETPYPQLPLERVEIDHTRSDLIVIDDRDNLPLGRLTLTYCLDTATRYPLGYYMGFEPPSYLTVMECLHHAIRPKENIREAYETEHEWLAYGLPSVLVVDNGKEFIGQDLQDACLLLGIVLQQTPVKTPHFKAGIERLFRTLNTMLFHTLPGTTFSNPQNRGDYGSAKQACVYLSDVDRIMHIFIVDIYAQRFHQGIQGIPAQRWDEAATSFCPRLPSNVEELSILLGRVSYRALHHYGVQFQSLRYNSPQLAPLRTRLREEKVKVKYHPGDLSRLYIYDPFEQRYIEVPALDQEYTEGLSLWKHHIIRRVARAEFDSVDLVALGLAKRKIQEIVEAGRQRKRTSTRARVARWDTAGKPSREVLTKELVGEERRALPCTPPSPETIAPPVADELAEATWEVSYDLPGTQRNLLMRVEETDEATSHGKA